MREIGEVGIRQYARRKGERERMRYVLDIERIQSAVIPNETLETPDQIAIVDGRYVVAIQEAAPPQKLSGAELDTKILYIVHAFVQVGILVHLPLVVVVRMFHPRLVVHDRPVPHPGPHPKRERGGGGMHERSRGGFSGRKDAMTTTVSSSVASISFSTNSPEVSLVVRGVESAQWIPNEGYHAVSPLVYLLLEIVVLHPVIATTEEVLLE